MTADEYHDAVHAEARALVAKGHTIEYAVAQANRTVKARRQPGISELAQVVGVVMAQLDGARPTRQGR